MPWQSRLNAEIYDRFARERRIYDWLNRHLVDLAALEAAEHILDLASGTGSTTLACLPRMRPYADILGVDASLSMVDVARANVLDPRAHFEVAAAAAVHDLSYCRRRSSFDRVVCNAAFSQFPSPSAVLHSLAAVTAPGALFVFNVAAELVRGETAAAHPFQATLRKALDAVSPPDDSTSGFAVDPDALERLARDAGFEPLERVRRTWQGAQGELMELMAIPAMIERAAPDLDEDLRRRALERARAQTDPEERVAIPWLYFVMRRAASTIGSPTGETSTANG